MIPLRDTVKSRTVPFVNYLLIGVCGVVYLYEVSLGDQINTLFASFAVIPANVSTTVFHGNLSLQPLTTLFSSMFLHGGLMHLLGNMLYLYIFGDNVEDRLGHGMYLLFYIASGIGAALVEVYFHQQSGLPLIGASGAIAGVLGAYFILYPRAKVLTMIPLFVYFPVVEIYAFFFLGLWLVMQFLQGGMAAGADAGGGVAWWAHAGGFVIGALVLSLLLVIKRLRR